MARVKHRKNIFRFEIGKKDFHVGNTDRGLSDRNSNQRPIPYWVILFNYQLLHSFSFGKMCRKVVVMLFLATLNKSNSQACLWEISWELDCIRSLNIGFKCGPSGLKTCQNNYGTVSFFGCWSAPSKSYTSASPPYCYTNTGWVGSPPNCLTRTSLLLCINGVPYEHGDIICCNDPPGGIYPYYPYCISCGCAIVQIDEAAEKIDVTDPRPFGNFCPPSGI
jgi:hypothetical protein